MGFFDFFKDERPPLIDQAFADVLVMLKNGHNMFAAAAAMLLDNEILEIDLHELDQEINGCEQKIRTAVLEHLNLEPNRELVFSLKLVSIVHEAERIGDLTKSIAKVAALSDRKRIGPRVEPLRAFRDRILEMFDNCRKAFVESDSSKAMAVMETHESMKSEVAHYLEQLAADEDLTGNEGVVYALGARMISRVSSHLANIASAVAAPYDQIRRASTWQASARQMPR